MEIVWIIGFWLIGTFAVVGWADRKGLGVGYFLASLFFSPVVGVLLVAIAKPNSKALVKRGKLKQCPDCAEYAQPEAHKCPFCGHQFTTSGPA